RKRFRSKTSKLKTATEVQDVIHNTKDMQTSTPPTGLQNSPRQTGNSPASYHACRAVKLRLVPDSTR
ncbi:hypothetical protein, partial [Craterilacuibacter sp.]|uniref:hypothetical protein n=1 Tax=Craterilacuibacter sp. TaxID=2870909 RepID=UPI003F315DE7